jgi:hypothetical protein
MKLLLTIAPLLFILSTAAPVTLSQKSCSCEKAPNSTCHGIVTCPDGCTALCGSGDSCYLSCRKDLLNTRITVRFVKKEGQEIASVLSERTRTRIEFVPYPRNLHARYDLELKDDDIWNACNFLNERGNVRIRGVDFEKLKELRGEMRKGRRFSVNFNGIAVRDAVAKLSFMSGLPFRVKSGDPEKLVSISLEKVTLDNIVVRISERAGVKIERGQGLKIRRNRGT